VSARRGRVARGVGGALVLGLVGAVAVLGSTGAVPAPAVADAAAVRVPASARTLVCPGPLALPADDGAGDAAFDPTPVSTVTTQRVAAVPVGGSTGGASAGAAPSGEPVGAVALTPVAGGPPLLDLPAGAAAVVGTAGDVPSATVLRADPSAGEAAVAGGASASVTLAGDLRGLAATTCRPPSADTWLVGGSTEIGSSALLVVANPGRTPAEVSVAVFGPSGPVETPGATFLVAPGAERALLLEGVAAEQRRLAVHVTAAGGLVSAHLQDSRLDGFTPAGTDLVTAGAAPSSRQVLSGLVVRDSAVGDEDAAQVRLLATGEEPGTARLTLLGPDGPVTLPGADRLELGPGEVTDLSLAGLPAGPYTAVVESDVPLVAGAMLTRLGPPVELGDIPQVERAWVAAADPGAGGVVAVPDGVVATVVLAGVAPEGTGPAGGTVTGTLLVRGDDGEVLAEQPVTVPTGSSIRVDAVVLAAGRAVGAVELVPDDPDPAGSPVFGWAVLATVGSGPDQLVSVLTPVPRPEDRPTVRVREDARLGLP